MPDLISRKALDDIKHWPVADKFKTEKVQSRAQFVLSIYEVGRQATLWEDAEQFLQRIEIASTGNQAIQDQIRALIPSLHPNSDEMLYYTANLRRTFEILHWDAVRFVAAACTRFMIGVDESIAQIAEEWQPYVSWVLKLRQTDTVITFNYDRVLDVVNKAAGGNLFTSPMQKGFKNRRAKGQIAVCHMHGNVSWRRSKSGISINGQAVAHLDPRRSILGTPGHAKKSLKETALKLVWQYALERLADADSIVFVGYRFPQSDNLAKSEILAVLRQNSRARIHSVLGPASKDSARLTGMLRLVGRTLEVHEMYTEDFFAAFQRELLF